MPFAIWCTNCKPRETLIGQGVRFNAEKKKVGNYYSTPIYSFRMKHTACGGWIEIRTDPKNTAYVVTEGARKRDTDTGEERAVQPEEIRIKLPGERETGTRGADDDPFARLEGKVEDKRLADTATGRILELQKRQSRDWDDPYEQSRRLRRTFRMERKALEKAEANREALKDKMSLGIELVDETEEDRLRAGMVDFGSASSDDAAARMTRLRPMFDTGSRSSAAKEKETRNGKRLKPADLVAERKAALRSELNGNTRAAVDPFIISTTEDPWHGVKKRKLPPPTKPLSTGKSGHKAVDQPSSAAPGTPHLNDPAADAADRSQSAPASLVNYDSESE